MAGFLSLNNAFPIDFNTTPSVVLDPDDNGIATDAGYPETQPGYQVVIQSALLILVWVVSIPMNTLVCLVIYRSRRVQSTTNYFVVSIAFSDLLFTVFCVPFVTSRLMANRWVLGPIMCRLVRFIQILAPTTTVLMFTSISVDRFYTIIYPLSFKITRGTAKRLIVTCWVLALVFCIFSIYFFEPTTSEWDPEVLICPAYLPSRDWLSMLYGCLFVTLTFILPVVVISIVYSRIFRYVWTTGLGPRGFRRTNNNVPRTKVKMLKMLIIVTASTCMCYCPAYAVQLWYTLAAVKQIHTYVFSLNFLLIFATTISKPFIYTVYNSNFRRGCREVFCMSNMKCYRSHTYAITTASHIGKKNHVGVMPQAAEMVRNVHSPSMAFNRSGNPNKLSWPLDADISTTYI